MKETITITLEKQAISKLRDNKTNKGIPISTQIEKALEEYL
jgi:hypothetical protein